MVEPAGKKYWDAWEWQKRENIDAFEREGHLPYQLCLARSSGRKTSLTGSIPIPFADQTAAPSPR